MKKILLMLSMIFAAVLFSCGHGATTKTSLVTIAVGNNQAASIRAVPATFTNKAVAFFAKYFRDSGATAFAAIPSVISDIRVTVSAPDMPTISQAQNVAGQSTVVITLEVPNGLKRDFLIEGLNSGRVTAVTYWSEFIADLTGAELNQAVDMLFIGAAQNYLYVDNVNGVDNPYAGTRSDPFKTITYALNSTNGNTAIFIQPGLPYNLKNGESFPLSMPLNTALVCMGNNFATVIDSTGTGATTISGAAGAVVNGCRINGEQATTAITDNSSAMTIISSYIFGNLNPGSSPSVCIALTGNSRVSKSTITGCSFNTNGVGISIGGGSPIIELNTITGNQGTGISISTVSPTVTNNTITNNTVGISIGGSTGTSPLVNNNIISCNANADLNTSLVASLDFPNNSWDHAPPQAFTPSVAACPAGIDICYSGLQPTASSPTVVASPCP